MINERLAALDTVIQALQSPLQNLDDLVENDLVELVFSIAGQLIRREINTQPDQIIAVIRDSLGVLPTGARDIRVFLHPEDAKLARELMSLSEQEQVWKIIEDPSLTRGGCRVQTEHSRVDATVESRLNEVIASVLGDERQLALQDKDDEPR
jgi:flagellar assembly protein FliH